MSNYCSVSDTFNQTHMLTLSVVTEKFFSITLLSFFGFLRLHYFNTYAAAFMISVSFSRLLEFTQGRGVATEAKVFNLFCEKREGLLNNVI